MEFGLGSRVIACSLREGELAERRSRWHALQTAAGAERVRTARGMRLTFRTDPGVGEELQRLVALERDCCSFADWSLRPDGARLVLHVTGHGDDAIAAVRAMFGSSDEIRRAKREARPERR
jgi:hypothetical protein